MIAAPTVAFVPCCEPGESIIFMDTNKQYMLRYDLAKSDKVITIYLYSKLDNKSIKTGMYYDKNNTYIVSDIYNININKTK